MVVGVPKEIKANEFRVGMTPSGAGELIKEGHCVLIEKGAGAGSGFDDGSYLEQGAVVVEGAEDIYAQADLIVKVKEPVESEYPLLREGHILFTYLHLAADKRLTEVLCEKRITAFGYETLRTGGRLPLLEPMSEIAGRMAALFGSVHLGRYHGGSGRLMGGAVGVEPGRVVILGAGTAGKAAAETAAGMGAEVVMMDINSERLHYLRDILNPRITLLHSSHEAIVRQITDADLIIGTVLVAGAKTPRLITREMLGMVPKGSVLVDVSIDQGGCFETSRPTTHADPTYEVDGIIHYCVANMPGMYPRTSTIALTNATLPYIRAILTVPLDRLMKEPAFHEALNTHDGHVANEAVASAHSMPFVPYP